MSEPVIVIFPEGSMSGTPATSIEFMEEGVYLVTFPVGLALEEELAASQELEGQTTIDEQIADVVPIRPDTSPSPEDLDYDELPELPDIS